MSTNAIQEAAYLQLGALGYEYVDTCPITGDINLAKYERGQEYVHLLSEIILHRDGTHTALTPRPPPQSAPSSTRTEDR